MDIKVFLHSVHTGTHDSVSVGCMNLRFAYTPFGVTEDSPVFKDTEQTILYKGRRYILQFSRNDNFRLAFCLSLLCSRNWLCGDRMLGIRFPSFFGPYSH